MKKSAAANRGDQLGQFRAQDAQRIASVVHIVETARRDRNPSKLPRAFGGGGGTPLRLCKTVYEFPKGTIATLEVCEAGTPPAETYSDEKVESVINKYADIGASKFVSVALHGNGRWYVVSAECG